MPDPTEDEIRREASKVAAADALTVLDNPAFQQIVREYERYLETIILGPLEATSEKVQSAIQQKRAIGNLLARLQNKLKTGSFDEEETEAARQSH